MSTRVHRHDNWLNNPNCAPFPKVMTPMNNWTINSFQVDSQGGLLREKKKTLRIKHLHTNKRPQRQQSAA